MAKWTLGQVGKTKPIQSQYKANTNPIQTQYKPNSKPIQTQFKANTNPIRSQYKPNSNPIQTQFKTNSKPILRPCKSPPQQSSVIRPLSTNKAKKPFAAPANLPEMSKEVETRSFVLPNENTKKLTIDKRVNMREN